LSRWIRSGVNNRPLVISVAMAPRSRMRAMIASRSGCSMGSPPLRVMIVVPSSASRSIRLSMVPSGTGSEVLSYSLQYPQSRLQRRVGTT
jgi:hypothetical protein